MTLRIHGANTNKQTNKHRNAEQDNVHQTNKGKGTAVEQLGRQVDPDRHLSDKQPDLEGKS